jgi:hypothetical protein
MLKNIRHNHKQEICFGEAAANSNTHTHKAKKSRQHLANTGTASKEDNRFDKNNVDI